MKRLALGVAALALVLTGLAGCTAETGYTVTAKVVDDSVELQAPALPMPKVNLDAGFVGTAPTLGRPGANLSQVTTALGLGSLVRVARTEAVVGDQVIAGQPLVTFDDTALRADVAAAQADEEVARRQIAVLDSGIQTTYDKTDDLNDAQRKAQDAITQLTKLRRQLTAKLAQAKSAARTLPGKLRQVNAGLATINAKLPGVSAQLAQAQAALAALPPDAPPEQRAQLEQAVAQLTAARAQLTSSKAKLTAARKQLTAAISALKTGIPKLTQALAKIATGLAKAQDGLRKIASGKTKLADLRTQLRGLKAIAAVAVDAAKTGITVARTIRGQAVVVAPVDGVVTSIADVGALLAPGATAAVVRPSATRLTTWLSPARLAQSCVGYRVSILGDWMSTPLAGAISRVGERAEYPPTSFPSDEVHPTRAVPVDLTLDAPVDLPVGVPLDVHVNPCHPAGTQR